MEVMVDGDFILALDGLQILGLFSGLVVKVFG